MLVTINTDASFHPRLKYGAYAFWAICNDFKITKSGVFRSECLSPDDAEVKCILNALQVVLFAHKGITKIIINTDSLNAIAILKNDREHIKKYVHNNLKKGKLFRQKFHSIIRKTENRFQIEYRHVKAHSGVEDKRSYVNEWCDAEAKRRMWSKVNSIKNSGSNPDKSTN